eukprot:9421572-Heterocapsa_arctica.AAC.1
MARGHLPAARAEAARRTGFPSLASIQLEEALAAAKPKAAQAALGDVALLLEADAPPARGTRL